MDSDGDQRSRCHSVVDTSREGGGKRRMAKKDGEHDPVQQKFLLSAVTHI